MHGRQCMAELCAIDVTDVHRRCARRLLMAVDGFGDPRGRLLAEWGTFLTVRLCTGS